jgi:hypothetical protein
LGAVPGSADAAVSANSRDVQTDASARAPVAARAAKSVSAAQRVRTKRREAVAGMDTSLGKVNVGVAYFPGLLQDREDRPHRQARASLTPPEPECLRVSNRPTTKATCRGTLDTTGKGGVSGVRRLDAS